MTKDSIYEKRYMISLCRFGEDEDISGTWLHVTHQELNDFIRIFSETHKITIRELPIGDK